MRYREKERKREIKWQRWFWHLTIQLVRFSPSFGHFVYAGVLESPISFSLSRSLISFAPNGDWSPPERYKSRMATEVVIPRAGEKLGEEKRKRGENDIYIYFPYVVISAIVIISTHSKAYLMLWSSRSLCLIRAHGVLRGTRYTRERSCSLRARPYYSKKKIWINNTNDMIFYLFC